MNFDKAVEAFKSNPSAENAWTLQQAMVEYAKEEVEVKTEEVTVPVAPKESNTKNTTLKVKDLETMCGKERQKELIAIYTLWASQGCTIKYGGNDTKKEWWILEDADKNKAKLCATNEDWYMESTKKNGSLKGVFENYDNFAMFYNELTEYGII